MRQDSGWLTKGGPFGRRLGPPHDRGRLALPQHAQQRFGTELARSVVVMVATLAVWGLALLVESYGHQHVDVAILAVAITLPLARTELERSPSPWWLPILVLPVAAGAASITGDWMVRDQHYGDALLAAALAAFIWVRRFGSAWSQAGTFATLPFIAALVTPFAPESRWERAGWWCGIGLLAALVTWLAVVGARWLRVVAAVPPPASPPAPGGARRIAPSTRMALQMGAGVALGFVAGRNIHPDHWQWPVLTAYIVASGNQGRGDVVHKSLQRGTGAAVGTVAASLLSGRFSTGSKAAVALIFVVLWIAVVLRRRSYAYWAGSITAALALMYGYFGEGGITVLEQRLEGIGLGAVAGVLAAWFLLPIRTTDVLRRRTSELLQALAVLLTCIRETPEEVGSTHLRPVVVAVGRMRATARPLMAWAHVRRLVGLPDRTAGLPAAIERCAATSRSLVRAAQAEPAALAVPAVVDAHRGLLADLTRVRASLRPGQELPTAGPDRPLAVPPDPAAADIVGLLHDLGDTALDVGLIVGHRHRRHGHARRSWHHPATRATDRSVGAARPP